MADRESKGKGWRAGSKLLKIAVGYVVVAWVVMQVAEIVLPALRLPDWTLTLTIVLLALGYPIALVLGWASTREQEKAVLDRRSIAVLPFADMSQAGDQAFFCEGMAAEIINDLVKVGDLRVASRTSSFSYRKCAKDAREIGEELGVSTILEGSVRKSGDRLRVDAQMINVSDGYHLWSERYDREFRDVFDIQDEIARSIVDALQIQLTPAEEQAISLPLACSPEAYETYLKGRHQYNKFGRRGLETALKWFEKTLELCDDYSPAYAGMADCLSLIYLYQDADDQFRQRALKHAQRAMELDPDSGEAHASLGFAKMLFGEFDEAERTLVRAVELSPDLPDVHYKYARLLWTRGDLDGSIEAFRKVSELDPTDYQSPSLILSLLSQRGDSDATRQTAEMARDRAVAHLDREPDDVRAMYFLAGAYERLGDHDSARQWCEQAITIAPGSDTYYNVACVYARMGDKDLALDLLEQADMKGSNHDWVHNDPDLVSLADEPRFHAVLDSIR